MCHYMCENVIAQGNYIHTTTWEVVTIFSTSQYHTMLKWFVDVDIWGISLLEAEVTGLYEMGIINALYSDQMHISYVLYLDLD